MSWEVCRNIVTHSSRPSCVHGDNARNLTNRPHLERRSKLTRFSQCASMARPSFRKASTPGLPLLAFTCRNAAFRFSRSHTSSITRFVLAGFSGPPLGSHIRALECIPAVPEIVVPDNLRSGMTKPSRYEPGVNLTSEQMAQHFGFAGGAATAAKAVRRSQVGARSAGGRVLDPGRAAQTHLLLFWRVELGHRVLAVEATGSRSRDHCNELRIAPVAARDGPGRRRWLLRLACCPFWCPFRNRPSRKRPIHY
jgi:hypothetical protein